MKQKCSCGFEFVFDKELRKPCSVVCPKCGKEKKINQVKGVDKNG